LSTAFYWKISGSHWFNLAFFWYFLAFPASRTAFFANVEWLFSALFDGRRETHAAIPPKMRQMTIADDLAATTGLI
jgi:hypothetical protein